MRVTDRLSTVAVLQPLRSGVNRLRHTVAELRPAIRWTLALGAALWLAVAGYWAATSWAPSGVRYLSAGRRFSSEDLIEICRAFDEQHIDYHQDERRLQVGVDQFDQASAIISKLDLGQRSIEELREQRGAWPSVWETEDEKKRKDQLACERIVESLISRMDGVVWSLVAIHNVNPSALLHSAPTPSAFVYIETEGDHKLPFRSVQSIPAILTGWVPGLTSKSITVMDRRGHRYLDSRNPSLGEVSHHRAQEEELAEKILEKLNWIRGVQVLVHLSTANDAETPASGADGSSDTDRSKGAAPHESSKDGQRSVPPALIRTPTMAVNRPLELKTEPADPSGTRSAAMDVIKATGSRSSKKNANGDRHHWEHDDKPCQVLVNVPRSFYFNALINKAGLRTVSPEDLHLVASRVEGQIKRTLKLIVPQDACCTVHVETIPDEIPQSGTSTAIGATGRRMLDWEIVGSACAAISIVVVVSGMWIHVVRRTGKSARFPFLDHRSRAHPSAETGSSERARDVIRLDPESAAGVLQCWATQRGEA
jgi:flagellar M-ring protein FliF